MQLRIMAVCGLALVFGLGPSASSARGGEKGGSGFSADPGQEVVNGTYSCDGTIFTDEQLARIRAGVWLSATSGITAGFQPTANSASDVPSDLDGMAEVCEGHIATVIAQAPPICTVGEVTRERGEFGNGASVHTHFDFSCQGTRNEVMGVIGGFSRLPLVTGLP